MRFTFGNPGLHFRQAVYPASDQASPIFTNTVYIKKMQTFVLLRNKSADPDAPKSTARTGSAKIPLDSSCHKTRNSFHTL